MKWGANRQKEVRKQMIYPTCLLNSAILAGFHCSSKETDFGDRH